MPDKGCLQIYDRESSEHISGSGRQLGPGTLSEGEHGGARLCAMGSSEVCWGVSGGLRVPVERGTFSNNKYLSVMPEEYCLTNL